MLKFRYHRGSLEESIKTTEDFNIENIIKNDFGTLRFNKTDKFIITYYGYDDRVKQDLWLLTCRNLPIGYVFNVSCEI